MESESWLGDGIWSVGCIQFLADNFLNFDNFSTENFEQKIEF